MYSYNVLDMLCALFLICSMWYIFKKLLWRKTKELFICILSACYILKCKTCSQCKHCCNLWNEKYKRNLTKLDYWVQHNELIHMLSSPFWWHGYLYIRGNIITLKIHSRPDITLFSQQRENTSASSFHMLAYSCTRFLLQIHHLEELRYGSQYQG